MRPTFPPRFTFFACFHRSVEIFNVEPYGPVQVKDAPGSSEAEWLVGTTEITQHQWKADAGILPSATVSLPATAVGQCTTGAGSKGSYADNTYSVYWKATTENNLTVLASGQAIPSQFQSQFLNFSFAIISEGQIQSFPNISSVV